MIAARTDDWLLYLRKSNGRMGIARQRVITTTHVERRGGVVAAEFPDADSTAFRAPLAPLPLRTGFDAMIAEMARRPGAGIAAWHADRLTRDPESTEILIRACMRGGHLITTARGGDYDVTDANGRKRLRDDANDAAYEVDHNRERLLAQKAEQAAEGRWLGGLRPFGWRPAGDGALALDEAEAALIRQGSADILAGGSTRAIARAWNNAGLTGSGGGRWTTSTVHKVLSRPRNAGLVEHRGQIVPVAAQWEAIVPEATWRAVSAILSDQSRRTNKSGTAVTHLLSGIALCGGCGVGVVVNASADGTPRYRCSRHLRGLPPRPGPHASRRVSDVDAFIAYLAVERLKRDDAAQLLRGDRGEERAALLGERAAAEARKREQWELYSDGVIGDLELRQGRKAIAEDLAVLDEKLSALEAADALAPFLASPERVWEVSALDSRRAAVSSLMHVTLMPGAKFSRPPGWKPGDGQFDPRLVDVRWVRGLPSDT